MSNISLKVRFSVSGDQIKGTVVDAPEGIADHKIVFVIGYRPERANTWRGVLPQDRETWICEFVKDTQPEYRKGALLVRLLERDPQELFIEKVKSGVAPWTDPKFIGLEPERTSGWFPKTYYQYYPYMDGAEEMGLEVQSFERLLLYKSGTDVVTGRCVRWSHSDICIKHTALVTDKVEEPVFGVIPPTAADGFYFWSGKSWETCKLVEVHATSVIVRDRKIPAFYRFVGLMTESGKLVPNQRRLITSQEFFSIRQVKTDEVTDLPVVETTVQKDGWWSQEERHEWVEPNLTEGFAPGLVALLERLHQVTIKKERIALYDERIRVVLVSDGESYELEYNPGHTSGDPDDMYGYVSWPTTFLQRDPGRTYRASSFNKEQKSDSKWIELMRLLSETPLSVGPVEEASMVSTGGKFYIRNTGTLGDYAVYCPHGVQVTRKRDFVQGCWMSDSSKYRIRRVLLAKWDTEECPFGCEAHENASVEAFDVGGFDDDLGVSKGMHAMGEIFANMYAQDPLWDMQLVGKFHGDAALYSSNAGVDELRTYEKAYAGVAVLKTKDAEPGTYTFSSRVYTAFRRYYKETEEDGYRGFDVVLEVEADGIAKIVSLKTYPVSEAKNIPSTFTPA